MQWMTGTFLLSIFFICHAEDFLKLSAIANGYENSLAPLPDFNRLDQEAAEANVFDALDVNYPYGPNPSNIQPGEPFLQQFAEGPFPSPLENQKFHIKPDYDYGYIVNEPITGDHKSHREFRRDNIVHGTYSLIEPDGTRRTVVYTADDINGFKAQVFRDPPTPTQDGGVYYDQDRAATGDAIREKLDRFPEESNFESTLPKYDSNLVKSENTLTPKAPVPVRVVPIINDIPVIGTNFADAPIIVPNEPVSIKTNPADEVLKQLLAEGPRYSHNFISEFTNINPSISPVEPSVPTVGASGVTPSLLQVSSVTPGPLVLDVTPKVEASSPLPIDEKIISNIHAVVENPNHTAPTTPAPDPMFESPSRLNPLYNGEFPLLAHISPTYAKRYARHFL